MVNIKFISIHFTYDLIDIWPSRDLMKLYMPQIFKKQSSSTRVIIDGIETRISKPSYLISQKATFSTYKNTNTVKFLIGTTPGGLISYSLEAYGGATSNR